MAITKKRKDELVAEYAELVQRSQALILTEYRGLTMPNLNQLRDKMRQAGGEYHITKNTLLQIALERAGYPAPADLFDGPTAVGFSFEDPAAVAKTLLDLRRDLEQLIIKGALMRDGALSASQVQALAELPPREVLLAQLLGNIQWPLASLVGILNAPLRELVYVLQQRGAQEQSAVASSQ